MWCVWEDHKPLHHSVGHKTICRWGDRLMDVLTVKYRTTSKDWREKERGGEVSGREEKTKQNNETIAGLVRNHHHVDVRDNLRDSALPRGPSLPLGNNLEEIPFVSHHKQFDLILTRQNKSQGRWGIDFSSYLCSDTDFTTYVERAGCLVLKI